MYFFSPHSLFYFFGMIILAIVVILEEVFGLLTAFGRCLIFLTRMNQYEKDQINQLEKQHLAEIARLNQVVPLEFVMKEKLKKSQVNILPQELQTNVNNHSNHEITANLSRSINAENFRVVTEENKLDAEK